MREQDAYDTYDKRCGQDFFLTHYVRIVLEEHFPTSAADVAGQILDTIAEFVRRTL